ncbi:MAG: DUF423 domain-containing protein [Flavobacteriales bacterium]|nr:DUF423 domain-containing protein [Flavobacteriales bacterium]MBP9081134.1 DUF423 domain-containing protein [Flavobacteriales bacterium]
MSTMRSERTLAWAAAIMMLAVALGAFGAHGIQGRVDERSFHNWGTAAQYQFIHGLALLGLAALEMRLPARVAGLARILFLLGILCFCGSLYLLAVRDLVGIQSWARALGPITPLGGLMFIAGWAVLLVGAFRKG